VKIEDYNFDKLPNILLEHRWNNSASANVLNQTLHILSPDIISELYSKQKRGAMLFGRLLSSFGKVYTTTEQRAQLKVMSQRMVDVIDLNKETISEISLLAHNLFHINEEAYYDLLRRIITELDLTVYLKAPLKRGFLPLVKQIKNSKPDKLDLTGFDLQGLVDGVFALPLDEIFHKTNLIELNKIWWELLQIDRKRLSDWAVNLGEEVWFERVKEENNKDALFRLCWILRHLDRNLIRKVSHRVWWRHYSRSMKPARVFDIPLLGLLLYYNKYRYRAYVPKPSEMVNYLTNNHYTLSHIAFTVWYYERHRKPFLFNLRGFLSRQSYYVNPQYGWDALLDSYPLSDTKRELQRILGYFKLMQEPEFTFRQIENRLMYNNLEMNSLDEDRAVYSICHYAHPKALFRDPDMAKQFLHLFTEDRGWELSTSNR